MSYVHQAPTGPEWVDSVADAPGPPQDDLTQRYAHIDALSPELGSILRAQMTYMHRHNDQIQHIQREMSEQFRHIMKRLDAIAGLPPHQAALHALGGIVTNYDTPNPHHQQHQHLHAGSKRPGSPDQTYTYPPPKASRTSAQHRTPSNPQPTAYYDPSQSQPPPFAAQTGPLDYQLAYAMPQRPSDVDVGPTADSFIADDHTEPDPAHDGAAADSSDPTKDQKSGGTPGKRDKPPAHLYYQPDVFMRRDNRTLRDLWKEYSEGLHGKPSIRQMTARYGTRWHYNPKEAMFWGVRKPIYAEIENLMLSKYNGNAELAIAELERKMAEDDLSSFHKLGAALRLQRSGTEFKKQSRSSKGGAAAAAAAAQAAQAASSSSAALDEKNTAVNGSAPSVPTGTGAPMGTAGPLSNDANDHTDQHDPSLQDDSVMQ